MIYPPIAHTLATCPSAYKYDLSSLQSMIVAGATVPQATIRAWDKRFTGKVPLRQGM